jgi:hypothetical protein
MRVSLGSVLHRYWFVALFRRRGARLSSGTVQVYRRRELMARPPWFWLHPDVFSFTGALTSRFFLGFCEAAWHPGAMFLLSRWYS